MGATAAILGCAGDVLGIGEAAFFREADPWGFILFARNIGAPDDVRRLTSNLRDSVGRDAPILIDQEGGRVQRLRAPHWREWLPPLDQVAATGHQADRALWLRYRIIADELRALGIDADCAPCADIAGPDTHPFLRNRCLGEDADSVARGARAVAVGLLAGGVLPVMKHMPGHGRATVDSHLDCPNVISPVGDLEASDFKVFADLRDLPAAMTGHIVFEGIDPNHPATSSPAVIRMIREKIGFDGLLMTDDLSMQALHGSIGARAAASIAAGCDLVLHCNGHADEMRDVVAAAGRMGAAAERRAEAALRCRTLVDAIDTASLEAEFEALLKGRADA